MRALVRPYRVRLFLGLLAGLLYAMTNGLMLLVLNLVVNVCFGKAMGQMLSEQLEKAPALVRPIAEIFLKWVPDIHKPQSNTGIILIICAFPLVMLFRAITGYLNAYLMNWVAARCVADLRTRLFSHLQSLSLSFFSGSKTGDLIARVTHDTQVLYSVFSNALPEIIRSPATVLVTVTLLIVQQPKLTLISLIAFPICVVPVTIYARKSRRSARAMQMQISELTTLMHESFTGHRVIKAYNLEEKADNDFRTKARSYMGHVMRQVRASEIPSQLTELLGAVGVSLVIIYSVLWGDTTKTTPGDFITYIMGIVLMYAPLKYITRFSNQLHQGEAASKRIYELIETPPTITDPPSPVPLKARCGDIVFENVDFDYGTEEKKAVLSDFNLTVKSGTMVALVGATGSGKTTVTNLILRFYDPTKGTVRIGGTDIRNVSVKDLRSQIALVTQDTIIFNESARYNIGLGRPGATDAEIQTAARHAFAHDFIMEKGGYDFACGERGGNLSGGQRQRLTIARAIVRDAPILILDEATSALDNETQRAVQAALDELMADRTTICIAHRTSTIENADMIVVLDQGKIVETGTHTELLARKGAYARLTGTSVTLEKPDQGAANGDQSGNK